MNCSVRPAYVTGCLACVHLFQSPTVHIDAITAGLQWSSLDTRKTWLSDGTCISSSSVGGPSQTCTRHPTLALPLFRPIGWSIDRMISLKTKEDRNEQQKTTNQSKGEEKTSQHCSQQWNNLISLILQSRD